MFKALLKTRLLSYIDYLNGGNRNKKGGKKRAAAYALLYVFLFAMFAMMIGIFFAALARPFKDSGLDWLYFAFYGMISFVLMVFFSIFMTQSQLYDAKDNELLLSMPVPPAFILGSRICALLLENFVYGLVVAVPAIIVWLANFPLSPTGILAFALITLSMPFFAFAVTGIFGYLLHMILSRLRNKTIFSALFAIVFLGAYFYFYNKLNTYIQYLAANGQEVADTIAGYVKPVLWLGRAASEGNIKDLCFLLLLFIGSFAVIYAFLSATFIKTATVKRGVAKVRYTNKPMRVSTASGAIIGKEIRKLFSSSVYLLNAGIGMVMLLIGVVYLVVKKSDIEAMAGQMPAMGDIFAPLGALAICLLMSMTLIAPVTISLEGKSLWILKSMPLKASAILSAKADTHIICTLPFGLVASAALIYVLDMQPLMIGLTVVLPAVFSLFTAYLGVAVNLRFPKLDWVSEAQVVKRGASVMICMFGTMLLVIVPPLLYMELLTDILSVSAALAVYTGVIAVGAAALRMYLGSKAASQRFYMI